MYGQQTVDYEQLFPPASTLEAFSASWIRNTPDSIYGNLLVVSIDPCSGGCASDMGATILAVSARAKHVTVMIYNLGVFHAGV